MKISKSLIALSLIAILGSTTAYVANNSNTYTCFSKPLSSSRAKGYQAASKSYFTGSTNIANVYGPFSNSCRSYSFDAKHKNSCVGYGCANQLFNVKAVQFLLNHHYILVDTDGYFGPKTCAAIKSFQRSHGHTADGICGLNTWRSLIDNF